MINEIFIRIKEDKILYEYFKYHSYWYEELLFDNRKIELMIKEMKKEFRLNKEAKLEDLSKKIALFSSVLEILS